jgi:hypothetical protein
MTELDIAGLGIWSPYFSNWSEFSNGVNTGDWQSETALQPDLIPARERRRAPQSVKLAVEVMSQACKMAGLAYSDAAAVFSSSMGDMQNTDQLCRALSSPPRLVSPTRFHNSVLNATVGYWSIAGGSHAASNAVSARNYTAPMAFLEAAIQTAEEGEPVLLVTQEMAAPPILHFVCPSDQPFSSALLLTPKGYSANPIASLKFSVERESVNWPELPQDLNPEFESNYGARLLPLIDALAKDNITTMTSVVELKFPLSSNLHLKFLVSRNSLNEPENI